MSYGPFRAAIAEERRCCWIALPYSVIESIESKAKLPLMLRLFDAQLGHPLGFVCWAGEGAESNAIEMAIEVSVNLELRPNQLVKAEVLWEAPVAESVVMRCTEAEDYQLMHIERDFFEGNILNQGALVTRHQFLPVWLRHQQLPIQLKTVSITPQVIYAQLTTNTEITILSTSDPPPRQSRRKTSQRGGSEIEEVISPKMDETQRPSQEREQRESRFCILRLQRPPGDAVLPLSATMRRDSTPSNPNFLNTDLSNPTETALDKWFASRFTIKTPLSTAIFLHPDTAAEIDLSIGDFVYFSRVSATKKEFAQTMLRVFYSCKIARGHCVVHDLVAAAVRLQYGQHVRLTTTEPSFVNLQADGHAFTIRSLSAARSTGDERRQADSSSALPNAFSLAKELSSIFNHELPHLTAEDRRYQIVPVPLSLVETGRKWLGQLWRYVPLFLYGGDEEDDGLFRSFQNDKMSPDSHLALFLQVLIVSWLRAQSEASWECHVRFRDATQTGCRWAWAIHSGRYWISPQSLMHFEIISDANSDYPQKKFALRLDFINGENDANNGVVMESFCLPTALEFNRCRVGIAPATTVTFSEVESMPDEIRSRLLPPWLDDLSEQCCDYLRSALIGHKTANSIETGWSVGLLLVGGSKSGKSSLVSGIAQKLAHDIAILAEIQYVPCRSWARLMETSPEEYSQKKHELYRILESACTKAPSVVILDDIDSWCPAHEDPSTVDFITSRSVETIRIMMDETRSKETSVVFVATCENLKNVDEMICKSGFFDKQLQLPSLTTEVRRSILAFLFQQNNRTLHPAALSSMAKWDAGFEYADLERLANRVMHCQLSGKNRQSGMIIEADVNAALNNFQPAAQWKVTSGEEIGNRGARLEDVGGLESVKRVLIDCVKLPLKYPQLMRQCPLRIMTNVLLFGPPGSGKTYIVSALKTSLNVRMICVKGPELLNKYIGQSEAAVRQTFKSAAEAAPCILFFDEFDALARHRGRDSSGVSDRVVNQMLAEMDGVENLEGVSVIAATSRPDLIDKALLRPRRLDRHVFCPLPNEAERVTILQIHAQKICLDETVDLENIAQLTENYSGADLATIISEAHLHAVGEHLKMQSEGSSTTREILVNRHDVDYALGKSRCSVAPSQYHFLRELYLNFISGKVCVSKDAKASPRDKGLTFA